MAKVRVNWGPLTEGSVRLYGIHNTSHRCLYVLAGNERAAMSIACTANHIYSPEQKIALNYSRLSHEVHEPTTAELRNHWTAIQCAIARRLQGTVHFDAGETFIGYEAIAK
jgi:hypothetical protein